MMKTKTFDTNIKCDACVAKVTPFLNEAIGADQWKVDLTDPKRTLTIATAEDDSVIVEALKKAGYKAVVKQLD